MSDMFYGSSRRGSLVSIPAVLLAAGLISVAGAGCIDAAAPDQPVSEANLIGDPAPAADTAAPLSLREAFTQLTSAHAGKSVSPGAAAAAISCSGPASLFSFGNSRWVSAELAYGAPHTGELRARATGVGPWEQYDLCFDSSDGTFQLFARGNSLWVSAELAYAAPNTGELRARATAIGPWERFFIDDFGSFITLTSAASGLVVSAELGNPAPNTGMLRARATAIGPWEQFQ
jgi:hypothetical protein